MEKSHANATFDCSFDAKLSEAKGNWVWNAQVPDCWDMISDEDEGAGSLRTGLSGAVSVKATPLRRKMDAISSPHLDSPQQKRTGLPFSTCDESPISKCVYAASTPFHGRIVSASSIGSDPIRSVHFGNETFDKFHTPNASLRSIIPEVVSNNTFQISQTNDVLRNVTFDARPHATAEINTGNKTFAKEDSVQMHELSIAIDPVEDKTSSVDTKITSCQTKLSEEGNKTFAKEDSVQMHELSIAVDPVEDKTSSVDTKMTSSETKLSEEVSESNSDMMESCTKSEASEDSNCRQERKPLKCLPQPKARSAIPKKNSKIALPRMNAAAISRIQARSPHSKPGSADPENKSRVFKKPLSANGRKSLLPSSMATSKLPASANSRVRKPTTTQQSRKEKLESSITPTKRKAKESPKRLGQDPKIAGKRVPTTFASTSLPLSTSRVAQRNSGLKGPSTYSRPCKKAPETANTSRISSAKQGQKHVEGAKKQASPIPAEGNLRPSKAAKTSPPRESQSHVALAILLDYVVNKLNGLSAPNLLREVRRLKCILEKSEETKIKQAEEADELRCTLHQAEEKICVYANEIEQHKNTEAQYLQHITTLQNELDNTNRSYKHKITELTIEKEKAKVEFENMLTEVREQCENECQKLKDQIEITVQAEVEERMKPYVRARSEVESMTAVLEMKNETIRKLEAKCTMLSGQRDNMEVLSHKVEQLTQKNEDLSTQLRDKAEETRQLSVECGKLQQSFSEERSTAVKLRQHNEELLYRIDSASPAQSPFNPVFTTSPANDVFSNIFSNSRDQCLSRHEKIRSPNLLSYHSDDDAKESDNAI